MQRGHRLPVTRTQATEVSHPDSGGHDAAGSDWERSIDNFRLALARESWFAYQRFVDLLGGVSSASMIHPEAPSGAEVSIGGTTGYLVIFRFYRPLAAAPYAYLVLLDPTFNGDCSFMEVRLSWSGSAWNKTIAEAVPTEPRSVSMEVPVLVLPDGTVIERTTVPAGSAEYDDADDLTPLPRTFTFRAGDPPLIVCASGPLEWEVSYDCQGIDGPPERLVRIEFERAEKGTAEPSEIYLDGVRVWV